MRSCHFDVKGPARKFRSLFLALIENERGAHTQASNTGDARRFFTSSSLLVQPKPGVRRHLIGNSPTSYGRVSPRQANGNVVFGVSTAGDIEHATGVLHVRLSVIVAP